MKQTLKILNQSVLTFDLVLVLLTFIFSLCLTSYLGLPANIPGFLMGWLSCSLLLIALQVIDFYALPEKQLDEDHRYLARIFHGLLSSNTSNKGKPQFQALSLLVILIGGWAALQFVMLQTHMMPVSALWLSGVMAAAVFLAGLPSSNIIRNGYQELIQSLLLFGLFPAYAFFIVGGEFHILIVLICFPLSFFYLSWRLAQSLFTYAEDQKSGKQNFLQRIGWKKGMIAHNGFILGGFVLYVCIPLLGYPGKIFLSAILALPLGLLLIFMIFRIERGRKPEWQSVMLLEKLFILFMTYFIVAAMIIQ